MPYIKKELRPNLDIAIDELVTRIKNTTENNDGLVCGVLNYCITRILMATLRKRFGKVKYELLNMIDGVLYQVGRNIFERVGSPYERQKIEENGDVKEFLEIDQELHPGDYR